MQNRRAICMRRTWYTIIAFIIAGASFAMAQQQDSENPQAETAASAPSQEIAPAAAPEPAAPPQGEVTQAPAQDQEIAKAEPGNITVNFKGADIRTVLSYISEVSGVDIVPAPDVKGPVDLKLTNKNWKTALDIILRNYGFAYEREGDIIRVVTIDRLKQEELATQAFSLNYADSEEVVKAVKDMLTERGKVVFDARTNTVLVTDVPTNNYKIGEVIRKLDRKTPQVLIEARIIETTLSSDEKLGIDWSTKISITGGRRPTTIPFDSFKVPFDPKGRSDYYFPQVLAASPQTTVAGAGGTTETTEASEFPSNAQGHTVYGFPYAQTTDFTFGSLDFSQFSAVLEMLKQRANTDIISNPRITTLNNQQAVIQVGQTIGLPKYERNSTTGRMEITGYESKELGVRLEVTPHINEKNEIVIDMKPEIIDLLRYDILESSTGVVAPVFSARQAKTQVMVGDGETIFIGGLIRENEKESQKKLPFLGDLLGDVPFLGLLFTKKETVKEKTELIFFITVRLVTSWEEVKDIPLASKAYTPEFSLYKETKPEKRMLKK